MAGCSNWPKGRVATETKIVVWVSLELVLCVDSFLCAEVFESVNDM